MWPVDTGCGYDLVSKREATLIKRFVSKAKVPITFHTAKGHTRTENIVNIHVRELDEIISISPREHASCSHRWLQVHGTRLEVYLAYESIYLFHSP